MIANKTCYCKTVLYRKKYVLKSGIMSTLCLFMTRFIEQVVHVLEIVVQIPQVQYAEIVALLKNGLLVLPVLGREKKDRNGLLVLVVELRKCGEHGIDVCRRDILAIEHEHMDAVCHFRHVQSGVRDQNHEDCLHFVPSFQAEQMALTAETRLPVFFIQCVGMEHVRFEVQGAEHQPRGNVLVELCKLVEIVFDCFSQPQSFLDELARDKAFIEAEIAERVE